MVRRAISERGLMNRLHALVLAALLALASVVGVYAATKSTALGVAAEPAVSDAEIAKRGKKLDRAEAKLRRVAKRRPPALPPVPQASSGSPALTAAPAPPAVVTSGSDSDDHDEYDDHDHSGPGGGGEHDDDHDEDDDDPSGHGHGGDDDD
jgi:hypothetical protein